MALTGDIEDVALPSCVPVSADVTGEMGRRYTGFSNGDGLVLFVLATNPVGSADEVDARGWLRLEDGGPWFHGGEGSSVIPYRGARGSDLGFTLDGLTRMPACSEGAPTNATATYCPGVINPFCEIGFSFDLDGETYSTGAEGAFLTRHGTHAALGDDGALVISYSDEDDRVGGMLVLPHDGPDPGGLYCVAGGTRTLEEPTGLNASFVLDTLVRVGRVEDGTAVAGSVEGRF